MAGGRSLIREEELRSSKVTGGAVPGTESVVEHDEAGNLNIKDKNMGSEETLEDMLKGNYQPIKTFTTSASGTGTLLSTDAEKVVVTGTALDYTVKLPDATSAPQIGKAHKIYNASSQPIHVVSFSSSNVVTVLNPGQLLHAALVANSADGTWVVGKFSIIEEVTKEPTGFVDPEDVIVTYNDTTRKITLTGTVEAYYRGKRVIELVSGWLSPAHDPGATTVLFLYYNGSAFVWSTSVQTFDSLQIGFVFYDSGGTYQFALRESHGMQPWQTHEIIHAVIGTYRESGADISGIVLDSTTASERRPLISEASIKDDDLRSIIAAHTTGNSYSQLSLSGAGGDVDFLTAQDDIIDVSGITPEWNEFTGGAWQKTSLSNNYFMSVWLIALPASADATSQIKRFIWMAGQSESTTIETQRALSPANLELSGLAALAPEFVFIEQFIIREIGAGDWRVSEMRRLTGTKASTVSVATGGFLSSVSSDETLGGVGTPTSLLTTRIAPTEITGATYTVLAADRVLNVNAGQACTITYPTAEIAKAGRVLEIKNTGRDASTYPITIETEGAETIEGEADAKMNINGMSLTLRTDGSNLHVT